MSLCVYDVSSGESGRCGHVSLCVYDVSSGESRRGGHMSLCVYDVSSGETGRGEQHGGSAGDGGGEERSAEHAEAAQGIHKLW